MGLAQYYGICPIGIYGFTTKRLSIMYSCMLSNKAAERIKRVEEAGSPHMVKEAREKFINSLFKQMDDKFKDPHMVDEDELKRIFANASR